MKRKRTKKVYRCWNLLQKMRDEKRAVRRVSLGERDHRSLPAGSLEKPEVGLRTLKLNFIGESSRKIASTKSNIPIDSFHRERQKDVISGKEPSLSD